VEITIVAAGYIVLLLLEHTLLTNTGFAVDYLFCYNGEMIRVKPVLSQIRVTLNTTNWENATAESIIPNAFSMVGRFYALIGFFVARFQLTHYWTQVVMHIPSAWSYFGFSTCIKSVMTCL
jgi:hypothetical protein